MIRLRSIFMCLCMLSLAAVGFAVSPGGSVHGSGGVNKSAGVGQEGPVMVDLDVIPETIQYDAEGNDVSNKEGLQLEPVAPSNGFSQGASAGASRPQAQHADILRNQKRDKKAKLEALKAYKVAQRDQFVLAREKGFDNEEEGATNHLYLLALLALLLPPLIVYLHEGEISNNFYLAVLLTLCFWFPGMIFATAKVLQ